MGATIDPGNVRRIAVFRALYLGDLLLAVPALRSLRNRFPEAEITLIGLPWAASFATRFDRYLDGFAEFPGYPGISEVPFDAARTDAFLVEQRLRGYDLVIQLHGSGETSNPFVVALAGKLTVGHVGMVHHPGLDIAIPYRHDLHEIDRNLRLVSAIGCDDSDRRLEFPLTNRDATERDALLPPNDGPLVVIHPGAKFSARRWMPERFAAVGDALREQFGVRVVVTGGPGEEAVANEVVRSMRSGATDLAGRTSLGALAALIARADLVVSNDTGPAHVAVATGTRSVVLFGPADPVRWRPLDTVRHRVIRVPVACSPCGYADCPIDHRCLRSIDVTDVLAVATDLLRTGTGATTPLEYELEIAS